VRQLKREHPELVITDTQYGGNAAPIKRLFDANRKRPLMAIGELPDNSTQGSYYFASYGLLYDVHPMDEIVTLDDLTADNEKLLATYHPAKFAELVGPYRTWERLTLVDYSLVYYRVGNEYRIAGDNLKVTQPARSADFYATARTWFERALAVNPTLKEAKGGLSLLPK